MEFIIWILVIVVFLLFFAVLVGKFLGGNRKEYPKVTDEEIKWLRKSTTSKFS